LSDGGAAEGVAITGLLDTVPDEGADLPCRVNDPDLWFAEAPAELDQAKELCAGCPVRAECLAGALTRREPWGVWGGEIFERGAVIARKRPRGRPRKEDRARAADPGPAGNQEAAA
jgi:WhiB family redox-sensing transcriptional regulator